MRFRSAFAVLAGCCLLGSCLEKRPPTVPETEPIPEPPPVKNVIAGVVHDSLGAPVVGALIELGKEDRRSNLITRQNYPLLASSRTDSAGSFRFGPMPWGSYMVTAYWESNAATARITLPSQQRLSLTLAPTAQLQGIARWKDARDGSGLAVSCLAGPSLIAYTDTAGSWTIPNVPMGTWLVILEGTAYLSETDTAIVTVAPGETVVVDTMRVACFPWVCSGCPGGCRPR